MADWTPDELEALHALPREQEPPANLEQHVRQRLRQERRKRAILRYGAVTAAAMALLVSGFAGGRFSVTDPAEPSPQYALFIRKGSEARSSARAGAIRSWAMERGKDGALLAGAKLTDSGAVVAGGDVRSRAFSDRGEIGGYFIVAAPGIREAAALAATIPAGEGAVIEVRQIEGQRSDN